MPISAEYDREADALYVRLRDGDRLRALEIDQTTYIDVDAENRAIGIEFLYPSMGLNLLETVRRFSLEHQLPELIAAISESGAPVPPQTMTTGQRLASTISIMIAPEGTVIGGTTVPSAGLSQADRLIQVGACSDAG